MLLVLLSSVRFFSMKSGENKGMELKGAQEFLAHFVCKNARIN